MTPEGRVKLQVDKVLKNAPRVHYRKPVQNGMGQPMLDYHGCSRGRYFAIETKAFNEWLTPRQEHTRREIEAAGGTVFIIVGADVTNKTSVGLMELILYLGV